MNLASYLRLLDYSSRLLRAGKARVPHEVAEILARLSSSPDISQQRMEKLRDRSRIFGTVFATKRSEINRMAESRGVKKLSSLNGHTMLKMQSKRPNPFDVFDPFDVFRFPDDE